MTEFPVLLTKRLRLRRFRPDDLAGLHACLGDDAAMRYWNHPPAKDVAETGRILKILAKTTSPYSYLAWAVTSRTDDRCIGMVNYHHREARNHRLEIGYVMAPGHQRRGYMGEALRALLDHCFTAMAVHRVDALIQPKNAASIALATSLGFRREGVLRDYWRVGDAFRSVAVYSLIAGQQAWKRGRAKAG